MIGDIVKIRTPYFDSKSNSIRFKSRPGLIIGNYGPTDSDYLVLPISKISHSRFRHPTYDLLIDPQTYPLSNLTCRSYIRCHKQVTIRRADISDTISKFKVNYPEKYSEVIELLSKFDKEKIKNA
jgi:ABC-type transporter lipoprotein component MlaA